MLAEFLAEKWGSYTTATRKHVLAVLVGALLTNAGTTFLLSEGFIAKFDDNLATPMFQLSLAFLCAFIGTSLCIFTPFGGGAGGGLPPLMSLWNQHSHEIAFLVLTTFGTLNARSASTIVMSETPISLTLLATPLFMPLLAVMFERERDGTVRQYGLWPCCFRTPNTTNPYYGVFPGLALIVATCCVAVYRANTLRTGLGVALAVVALILEVTSLVSAAVILGRGKPDMRTPLYLAWWVSLLAVPLFLIASLPFHEAERIATFWSTRTGDAVIIYGAIALCGAGALVLRYMLIHAASMLTMSIVFATSLALSAVIVMCLHAPGPGPWNWCGFLLTFGAVYAHYFYMREREKRTPPIADAESGKGASPANETSALVDPAGAKKSSTDCAIA